MRYKLFNFDTKDKTGWGDYQLEISKLFSKCRNILVESLGLKEGFILLFVRKETELSERILALLEQPTDDQRGYYWGVILPTIQQHFKKEGNFIEYQDLHDSIKQIICSEEGVKVKKVNEITGEAYEDVATLSSAGNQKEAAEYINAVILWASSYGIYIPEANY